MKKNNNFTPFEKELLIILKEEEDRFKNEVNIKWEGTIWSHVSFRMAQKRNKVFPSPVYNKFNIKRDFRLLFSKTVKALQRKGFIYYRKIGDSKKYSKNQLGYNLHALRDKDIFLTEKGEEVVKQFLEETKKDETYQEEQKISFEYIYTNSPKISDSTKKNSESTSFTLTFSFQ